MQIEPTLIPGCLLITPQIYGDARGFFLELHQTARYQAAGLPEFVQDNFSRSVQGTLRGLHYQRNAPQAKLVQVIQGAVFDVVVDLRQSSPAFGKALHVLLDDQKRQQLFVPAGCAHGFYVLSPAVDFLYKCSDYYAPGDEHTLQWNDPALNIPWPVQGAPILSAKDQQGKPLAECVVF